MSFGKMNTFIDIISVETSKDSEGFSKPKDTILASVRAYKEDRHGNEKWANRAVFSEATALFCFRRIPDIEVSTNMVIVCSDGRYEITNVEDVKDRGMYIEAMAKKVVGSSG
jgi:head-tail adaptor